MYCVSLKRISKEKLLTTCITFIAVIKITKTLLTKDYTNLLLYDYISLNLGGLYFFNFLSFCFFVCLFVLLGVHCDICNTF
jgi:hypothetical protein